ncbi:MAG TPA: NosD domain-containing protein [Chthonomonadaceae bacterium]|nr:NosD domain-containing protein [Chthonomonadaceae bacterium]
MSPPQDLNTLLKAGGVVQLEPTTYQISNDLIIGVDGTCLLGCGGAVIQKTAVCQVLITASWCHIESVKLDGNGFDGAGFFITGSFNSILRCRSERNNGHGFAFDGGHLLPGDDLASHCKFNEIKSCFSIGNGGIGISEYHHWDGRIIDNACFDNGLEGITVDVWSLRNLIMGNSLQHNCKTGGVGAIGMDYADLNRVTNNFIEQASDVPGITLQNNIGQSNYNIISNNVIVNPTIGILLKANTAGPPDPRDKPLQLSPRTSNHNMVADNIVRGATGLEVQQEGGCIGNDIRGNMLTF